MKKKPVRILFYRKRLELSPPDYLFLNRLIRKQVVRMDWRLHHVVHFFLSMGKFREIDTWSIIRDCKGKQPTLDILVPRINFSDEEINMEAVLWDVKEPVLQKK